MARVTFKVNTDRLNGDANQMTTDIQKILVDLNDANKEINALSVMWKGEANQALTTNFNEAHQWMVSFLNDFLDYAEVLANDSKEYNVCENKVMSLVNSI